MCIVGFFVVENNCAESYAGLHRTSQLSLLKTESQLTQDRTRFEEIDEIEVGRAAGSARKLCFNRGSLCHFSSAFGLLSECVRFMKYLSSFIVHLAIDAQDSKIWHLGEWFQVRTAFVKVVKLLIEH